VTGLQPKLTNGIRARGKIAEMRGSPLIRAIFFRCSMKSFRKELSLHMMILPSVIIVGIFSYLPMYGIKIAFQRFIPAFGFFGKQAWIGLNNFRYVLSMPNTFRVLGNTLYIAIWKIVLGLLVPIIFAILLGELRSVRLKKTIQTIVYFPHFLSWVVLAGILLDLLSSQYGLVNELIKFFGGDPIFFLGNKQWFPITMIVSDVWKNFGFKSVVYAAAMLSVDTNLYEAAAIDGAGRFRQVWLIDLPGMRMVIILMTVLSLGDVLNAGFDQVYNLINPMVYETGDIIDTLVYRMGLLEAQYGPATAVGLFKSVVSFILISTSYWTAYRLFDYRIF